MRTPHTTFRPSSVILLDTAWMPLEGITEQWAHFAEQATSACALRASSTAFAALAAETDALQRHHDACQLAPSVDLDMIGYALQYLVKAWEGWTRTLMALDPLLADAPDDETITTMLTQALQQRTRLSCLLQELEREHLGAYQQIHQHDVTVYVLSKEG